MSLKRVLACVLVVFSCVSAVEISPNGSVYEVTLDRVEQVLGKDVIDFSGLKVRKAVVSGEKLPVLQGNFTTFVTLDNHYEAAVLFFKERDVPTVYRVPRQNITSFYNEKRFFSEFKAASNLPKSVPVKKGTYTLTNYKGVMEGITRSLRSGNYVAELRLYNTTLSATSKTPLDDGVILRYRIYFLLVNTLRGLL